MELPTSLITPQALPTLEVCDYYSVCIGQTGTLQCAGRHSKVKKWHLEKGQAKGSLTTALIFTGSGLF